MTEDARRQERAAELIGAALADDLTTAERAELDALCAADPALAQELAELRQVSGLVEGSGLDSPQAWDVEPDQGPPASLADRIRAIPDSDAAAPDGVPAGASVGEAGASTPTPTGAARPISSAPGRQERAHRARRAGWPRLVAAAAALLVVGGVGGQVVRDRLEAPPEGPPGTLGALEPLAFTESVAQADLEVAVVAHSWGTETVLEMEQTRPGETYEVLLVDKSGETYPAGTFAGSSERVVCRMNAALLRPDVAELEVRSIDGSYARVARLPEVSS